MQIEFETGDRPPLRLTSGKHMLGNGAGADVQLQGDGVLAEHARLWMESGQAPRIEPVDAASVLVNGLVIQAPKALADGDTVMLGGEVLRVRLAADELGATVDTRDALHVTQVHAALPRYVLRGISGAAFGRVFPVHAASVIGRDPSCDIRLNLPGLSRLHARLTPAQDGLLLEDLGSSNGSLLNEAKVQRAMARHGDELGFDSLRFRVIVPGQAEAVGQAGAAADRARPAWPLLVAGAAVLACVALVWRVLA